jgi:exodeoxyribonuclease V gamma subunit
VIDRTVATDDPQRAPREQVVVHHPLQPFDARNFVAGGLVSGGPWSFDAVNLEGARALAGPDGADAPFLPSPLPALDASVVELDQLERFVRHPIRAFLAARLGLRLFDRSRELDDALPVELDGLEQWHVAERLLAARMAGAGRDACIEAEMARGLLPPGALADPILNQIVPVVEELVEAAQEERPPVSLDVRVTLPDGTALVGTVAGVRGDLIHTVTYSRVAASHRLLAWVRLLALSAAWPGRPFEACTIGRYREGRKHRITIARLAPLRPEVAVEQLADLVDLWRRAMREPVPLYCRTSAAWAEARYRGRDPAWAAAKQWTSDFNIPKEDKDAEHRLVFGGVEPVPFEVLAAEPPRSDEAGAGWAADEPGRLGRYARRLWDGLLSHEEIIDK